MVEVSVTSETHADTCLCLTCKRARKAAEMRAYRKRRKLNTDYAQRDREYFREKMRERRARDPEGVSAYAKAWRAEHPGCFRKATKEWRERHPEYREVRNARRRERYANATPEERAKVAARYHGDYVRHREKRREAGKAWRERNKERTRAYQVIKNANRRAWLKQAGGTWTWEQFRDLCHLTGNRCYYCGCIPEKLTPDHAIPLARGGSNDITNLVPACLPCNVRKGTQTADEFITRLVEETN